MSPILPHLLSLFLASALYAAILATGPGRRFTTSKTWVTVVAGVTLVLAFFALYWPAAALAALVFFVAGGLPIVVGEIVREYQREQRAMERTTKE